MTKSAAVKQEESSLEAEAVGAVSLEFSQSAHRPSPWSLRFLSVASVLLGLSIPAIWIFVGYGGGSYNETLSFAVADGWCDAAAQGFYSHCFSDYAALDDGLAVGNLWTSGTGTATAYPASSWIPSILFMRLGQVAGDWTVGRNLFLLLVGACLLSPVAWVIKGQRGPLRALVLTVAGIATSPLLLVLDRGNSTGLIILPLLFAALSFVRGQNHRLAVYIVFCTLLKPHMLLIALLFLTSRRYAHLLVTSLASFTLIAMSFLLFPGSPTRNMSNWLQVFAGYSEHQRPDAPYPYNLGIGRTLVTLLDLTRLDLVLGASRSADLTDLIGRLSTIFSLVLIAAVTALFCLRRREVNPFYPLTVVVCLAIVAPGTSYGYYISLLLVPLAFLLRDPRATESAPRGTWVSIGILDDGELAHSDRPARIRTMMIVWCFALTMTPLVVPAPDWLFGDVDVGMPLGILQMLWGPITALLFAVCCFSMLATGSSMRSMMVRTSRVQPQPATM